MQALDNPGAIRRILNAIYLCCAVGLAFLLYFWLEKSPYLPVESVRIEGDLQRLNKTELEQAARPHIHGNMLRVDLNALRTVFSELPWVASADVRRKWPDTVEILIRERQPLARWEGRSLIDSEGQLFDAPSTEEFPVFSGSPDARATMVQEYRHYRHILAPTGLEISRMDYNNWMSRSLTLNNGIVLFLGRKDADQRLQRFVQVWPDTLAPRSAETAYIDLRYPDGMAVRYGRHEPLSP